MPSEQTPIIGLFIKIKDNRKWRRTTRRIFKLYKQMEKEIAMSEVQREQLDAFRRWGFK